MFETFKFGDWFGNSTNITGEAIFRNVTYTNSELINKTIQVRTQDQTWNFAPDGYHNEKRKNKIYLYNSSVPSPFNRLRNIYSGNCLLFDPPDFLWKEGVRRIGFGLRKKAFVIYFSSQ